MNTPIDRIMDSIQWEKLPEQERDEDNLPVATHQGILKIGEFELKCYQLDDETRLIDEQSVMKFLRALRAIA